jgi:Tfp pilus assembly protein PilV
MRRVSPRTAPMSATVSPAGLTLVEVLMSMMVAGIGILSVIVLLPLSFVRAIQATNLTNGTILRFNAECLSDINPSLLLRWQPNQTYSNATATALGAGDIVLVPNAPTFAFQCTTAGTSGSAAPAWNAVLAGTTTDGGVTWTTIANPPTAFVIDPLGWNTLGAPLQTRLGNNGAGAVDANAVPRFNGELSLAGAAAQAVTLPDSWVEQARGPVTASTANTITLTGPDLSGVGYTAPAAPVAALPIPVMSRVVMIDATGKMSETRIITGITPATGVVTWGGGVNDPLPGGFAPVQARVETQVMRYTWILTVHPNTPSPTGGPSWNVTATVFFNRPLVAADEQVYQATGADGIQTPFTVNYPAGQKPFFKKGGFMFDCYFGRWYRIVNTANDTGSQIQIYVDSARPQTDILTNLNFGVVFMRGVVDQFPLVLK